jgi:hypothetical protein
MQQIRPLYDTIRQLKVMLFSNNGSAETSDSLYMGYIEKLSGWQTKINLLNYAYYKKLRSLLTPTQQPRYDSLLHKMIERGRGESGH